MDNSEDSSLVLYTHEVSPWGDRAVAILREANLKFEYVVLNPFQAPEWLMPSEPIKRAKVRFASNYFAEKINPIMRACATDFHNKQTQATYKQQVTEFFYKFHEMLLEQAPTGPYFLGQSFSLADVAISPFFLRLQSFNKLCFDGFGDDILKECPRLLEFYQGISSRPSSQETFMGDKAFIDFQDSIFHFFQKPSN
ncbi:hypothetical protein A0J61_06442 [Choanephora cucurbitarum]|uniref:GST C-terminal domain-containing protein n=1 Tax=Choanephora cucurbitarum TaxID=101091 RepID=A0A1C7N9A3_9FUNG|nr:hypothetical protein A0J61_06442 [Choanephora cucurbitarum]